MRAVENSNMHSNKKEMRKREIFQDTLRNWREHRDEVERFCQQHSNLQTNPNFINDHIFDESRYVGDLLIHYNRNSFKIYYGFDCGSLELYSLETLN